MAADCCASCGEIAAPLLCPPCGTLVCRPCARAAGRLMAALFGGDGHSGFSCPSCSCPELIPVASASPNEAREARLVLVLDESDGDPKGLTPRAGGPGAAGESGSEPGAGGAGAPGAAGGGAPGAAGGCEPGEGAPVAGREGPPPDARDAAEAREVLAAMRRTLGFRSAKVFRVENPTLLAAHELTARAIRRRCPNAPRLQRWLFHGTTRAAAGAIAREGFDTSRSGSANGQALGRGVYLAMDACYSSGFTSADSVGQEAMLVCSAEPGDSNYHTKSGRILAVHRELQAFPRFVVYYRR